MSGEVSVSKLLLVQLLIPLLFADNKFIDISGVGKQIDVDRNYQGHHLLVQTNLNFLLPRGDQKQEPLIALTLRMLILLNGLFATYSYKFIINYLLKKVNHIRGRYTMDVIRQSTCLVINVRKLAKTRNRYNQAQHMTQDTNGKVTTSQ